MNFKEKYYIECNLNLLIEVDEESRDKVMKKINRIISSALRGEKVIHVSKNIDLVSDRDLVLSTTAYDPDTIN
jgi:hypothetical protein